jgi:dipeptidyl aminopeptidase/acylaminoacyl peptidase
MQQDIRATALYREAETLFQALRAPGTGQISDALDIHVAPNGRQAVFAGTIWDKLEGSPPTRICLIDLQTAQTRVLTFGPNTDRLPKFSPDGRLIAFLSDRLSAGDFQLYLLDPNTGAARATARVEGWVEYLHWSPDGKRILLGVAGHGADVSGGQGAVTSNRAGETLPSWMPVIGTSDESHSWRSAWVYELETGRAQRVSDAKTNIWETVWCGDEALAAVVSPAPGEGAWYTATLQIIPLATGRGRELYEPQDHLGWPAACPSGKQVAIVEAICSDRWIVAGDLRVIQTATGEVRKVDTRGVDITYTEWRSERELLLAGHRGFEAVIGLYDSLTGTFSEVWASRELTISGRYAAVSGYGAPGDCVLVGESYARAPEVAVVRGGEYRAIKSFDLGGATEHFAAVHAMQPVTWRARDGLEIQGWLLKPKAEGPLPLVMAVHGGPVWQWRATWLGRVVPYLMLVKRGYAVFFPNPRGSSGFGQDFARRVYGDMGGADAQDLLSGLDALVESGQADPKRLGVTGTSYGGFMTSWLITQDPRFAAAVPVAPHTNQVTEHLLSNIPHFMKQIMQDDYTNPGGNYFQRSPVMHAHKAKTPTLNICGALDRCTPPEEAAQFHSALLENSVESVLLTYPLEGHGIRKLPAAIDYSARLVSWFERLMPASP